jgi:protein-S-isoprenylcysteine O-methyltransferase Ste14
MRLGDWVGFAFFAFATALSIMAGLEYPSILAWLSVLHNGLLTFIFLKRRRPAKSDRIGLYLGLIAALLPIAGYPDEISMPLLIVGLVGYSLLLWALVVLWGSFGIAPADRGLVTRLPYNLIRHPMYLGELILRLALVAAAGTLWGYSMLLALTIIQILRIMREESVISGYEVYKNNTRWRLIPGVW